MSNLLDYQVNNGYIQLPVDTDADDIYNNALTAINTELPGWIPREGHIEVLLLEQFAQMCAEAAGVSALVPQAIFAYFGSLVGINPNPGAFATANTTWTMADAKGYTVPAGTLVGYQVLGNQLYQFETIDQFTVPGPSLGRVLSNAVVINGQNTLVCPTANFTTAGDVGRVATDLHGTTNIPANTTILSVSSPTTAILSANATGTPGAETITLGDLAGQTQTSPGAIEIQATTIGEAYNGLVPQTLTLITSLAFVSSIQSTNITSGGEDSETLVSYLDRLSTELQLLAPRPILPNDFAVLAVNTPNADVFRAGAINGLNPFANQLTMSDGAMNPTIGSWVAGSGCTVSAHTGTQGEHALRLTATGSTATAHTGMYPVAQETSYIALISIDKPTPLASETMNLGATFYDVNGNTISSVVSATVTPSSTGLSLAVVPFTTPANTTDLELTLIVNNSVSASTYDFAFANLYLVNTDPNNEIPDAALQEITGALSWTVASGWTVEPFVTNENGFEYTGTGAASGTKNATSMFFYLPAGTYNLSAYIDASHVTVGTPAVKAIYGGSTVAVSLTQTLGAAGYVSGSFTLGSPEMIQVFVETNNCTVQSGLVLTIAEPLVVSGPIKGTFDGGPTWGSPSQVTGQERMVTVVPLTDSGTALLPAQQLAVSAYLQSLREVNFIVNVIGPDYSGIDVTWSGVAIAGYNTATVLASANAAIKNYLSPQNWGGGEADPPEWDLSQNTVRYLSIVTVIGETIGLDYITNVSIGFHGQTVLGTSDLILPGFAPLPQSGTVTGNVT